MSAASFDYGVDDRAALAGVGFPDEQPVFLANGRRPNGIFHEVVVDLHRKRNAEHLLTMQ